MIKSRVLDKTYDSRDLLFKDLRVKKDAIISDKRKQIQKSFEKGIGLKARYIKPSLLGEHNKALKLDDNYYYLAVNSTKILDSHDDLHLNGIWNKTVKEQQGKNALVLDHEVKVLSTVVRKEHIEMLTAKIPFASIGKGYSGETEVLVYKFLKTQVKNEIAREWLESGDDIEASVRMQYVKIEFCMNSDEEEDKEAKKNFDKYYPQIANKEDFDEILYFFAVTEAKNIMESSLVHAGSNGATGMIGNKSIEPSHNDTQKIEPEAVEEDTSLIEFLTCLTNN